MTSPHRLSSSLPVMSPSPLSSSFHDLRRLHHPRRSLSSYQTYPNSPHQPPSTTNNVMPYTDLETQMGERACRRTECVRLEFSEWGQENRTARTVVGLHVGE
ncbi:hypothetical protein MtrunA17_Chr5g0407351 [Medicago truncatula]|uniref:Uncharacterized protein n=1 Tax=Medicago truncatula TaxID=3880 RepID=G7K1C4_MEDTR|nr:hypothetical protein MTR_5g024670 [Medicago truncatula]RHN54482.1 hypothetical protein MtrunA17_Chr5g0407351 [Medicago truncatula]